MPSSRPSSDVTEFRDVLQRSRHIVVLAGAGLSAASGIPTFRDGDGLWRSLDPTDLATPNAFAANPSLVWQFYHYRRLKALAAKPNNAHTLLAKLAVPAHLKVIAPEAETYHLITQNVDRLSVTALNSLAERLADKKARANLMNSVVEMHGRLFDVRCTVCDYCAEDVSIPLCPSLGAVDLQLEGYQDAGTKSINIPESDLPRCPACNSLARPGVVWFDEKPHHLDKINSLIFKADLCIVVGTSLTVRPASTYVYRVQRRKGKVAVFNLNPTERDQNADFLFPGPCEFELARVLGMAGSV